MQQSYAKFSSVLETLAVAQVVEDALQMNDAALRRHEVEVVRDFQKVPLVTLDKHKVLQILVNLIRNAKYALDEKAGPEAKYLRVSIGLIEGNRVKIAVADNGIGIKPENLNRVFAHGFTTKRDGHGFGLHMGALAANEMGGTLKAYSEGPGQGAVFVLELPISKAEA
jgi:C4-dicarboxylate-specific signal transduction histidine kinase